MAAQGEVEGLFFRSSDVPLRIARAIEGYKGTLAVAFEPLQLIERGYTATRSHSVGTLAVAFRPLQPFENKCFGKPLPVIGVTGWSR